MAQVKGLMVAVLILTTICLYATQTSAAAPACCREFSQGRIPFCIIKGYSIQSVTETCPIDAIIFHTTKGDACADQTKPWVQKYINQLRNKARSIRNIRL